MEYPKWVTGHGGVPTIVQSAAHEAAVVQGPYDETHDDTPDQDAAWTRVDRVPGSAAAGSDAPTGIGSVAVRGLHTGDEADVSDGDAPGLSDGPSDDDGA